VQHRHAAIGGPYLDTCLIAEQPPSLDQRFGVGVALHDHGRLADVVIRLNDVATIVRQTGTLPALPALLARPVGSLIRVHVTAAIFAPNQAFLVNFRYVPG